MLCLKFKNMLGKSAKNNVPKPISISTKYRKHILKNICINAAIKPNNCTESIIGTNNKMKKIKAKIILLIKKS